MQDRLRFTAQRRGDHVAVVCTGYDRDANPVHFEVDADTFRSNSTRQYDWATRALAGDAIMRAYLKIGVSADRAWEIVEAGLPADMYIGTEWRSAPVGDGSADLGDELFEGADDPDRYSGDGDR